MRRTLLTAGFGLALTISSTGLIGVPAGAETSDSSEQAEPILVETSRPDVAEPRPVRPPHPEVLTLACGERESDVADHVIACRWRSSTDDKAAGYQLWRIVDQNGRELVWRGGLDTTKARDSVSGRATVALYVVLALDADGNIVGQSRPSVIRFDPADPVDPIDPSRHLTPTIPIDPELHDSGPVVSGEIDPVALSGSVGPAYLPSYRHFF